MPTYDYKCNACGRRTELYQRMTEAPKRKCPQCGKMALERLIGTGAAVLFKGSGFYQTDYRSESYKKAAQSDTKPEGKPAESSPGGAPAKPKPDKQNGTPAAPKAGKDKARTPPRGTSSAA